MDQTTLLFFGKSGGSSPAVLDTLNVTANGTYTPPSGTDGYDEVNVNVTPALETLSATSNGSYSPSAGKDGFSSVTVAVVPELETKSITTNGTYTPSTGKDGFSSVTVNVPSSQVPFTPTGNYAYLFSIKNFESLNYLLDNLQNYTLSGTNFSDFFAGAPLNYASSSLSNLTINGNLANLDKFFKECTIGNYLPSFTGTFKSFFQMFDTVTSRISIPGNFIIKMSNTASMENASFLRCFAYCYFESFPKFRKDSSAYGNIIISTFEKAFNNCYYARSLDDVFISSEITGTSTFTTNNSSIFSGCYSLRNVPTWFIPYVSTQTYGNYNSPYDFGFSACYVLDEILNFPVCNFTSPLTSSTMVNFVQNCHRLKNLTFATNSGTPYTAQWSNQTIDLTKIIGYTRSESNILNYNSGITQDKKVNSQSTYEALKNDPDWYAVDIKYSRYNHTSAVNTINSLPDCSATGSNTIKFEGQAGTNTDGGAISNLTSDEIAVAAAKGWTVTIQ